MLENTFCHLPRIGLRTEQALWKAGIQTWNDFLKAADIPRISAARKPGFDRELRQAMRARLEGDASYFTRLPSTQTWRLWEEFKEEACFVDIETDHRNRITVLGVSDGTQSWQFVRGINLDEHGVRNVLNRFKLIVTFNGASFDLPIIKRCFGDIIPDVPHLDLRFAAARAGLNGGLKRIEKILGIDRPDAVNGVSGADAIRLWHAYRATGEEEYRDLLLQYNEEDILNLKPLAQIVYERLCAQNGRNK